MINQVRSIQTCPPRPSMRQIVIGLIGGVLGIGATAWLTQLTNVPLLMAPFGATCVLLFAAPTASLAQPRNVVGGHFISALVGIVIFQLLGNSPLSMAIAVGLAIALMQLCRAVHPPAGANPLVIMMAGVNDYFFLITPVLVGSLILILTALILNNIDKSKRWPIYWY